MPKAMPFQQVLDTLKNDQTAFPARYLSNFSDLTPDQLKLLNKDWPGVPTKRKQMLLSQLVEKLDDDFLVSYDEIAMAVIRDEDAEVRRLATRMLWESQDPHLVPILLNMLKNDPDESVRAEAAAVLGVYVYLGELDELPEGLLKEVEEALLLAAADEEHPAIMRKAMEALGFSTRPEATRVIAAGFQHHDPQWLASALFAMGRSSDKRWDDAVISALDHEITTVRLAAVEAAGELGIGDARALLLARLDEEDDDDVFRATIWSLSQIGGEDVRTYLENLLDGIDDDEDAAYIEDALENLEFTEELNRFDLLAIDPDDEDSLTLDKLFDANDEQPVDAAEDKEEKKPKASKKRKK